MVLTAGIRVLQILALDAAGVVRGVFVKLGGSGKNILQGKLGGHFARSRNSPVLLVGGRASLVGLDESLGTLGIEAFRSLRQSNLMNFHKILHHLTNILLQLKPFYHFNYRTTCTISSPNSGVLSSCLEYSQVNFLF